MNSAALSQVYLQGNAQTLPVLRTLGPDASDFLVTTGYDVIAGNSEEILAKIDVVHVKFGAALNVGQSFFEIADSVDDDIFDIYSLIYEPGTNNVSDSFEAMMDTFCGCPDVWYIANDEIVDHAWGRKALHILAQHADCGLGYIVVGVSELMNPSSDAAYARAMARVSALEAMGFVLCEDTPFMFLNTEMRLTPFSENTTCIEPSPELAAV